MLPTPPQTTILKENKPGFVPQLPKDAREAAGPQPPAPSQTPFASRAAPPSPQFQPARNTSTDPFHLEGAQHGKLAPEPAARS